MRLIKKYKNRRLYDTDKSLYITIDDLQQYVLDGIDFYVETIDGDDITGLVLLQVLMEGENNKAAQLLSAPILKQLIKLSHHPLSQQYQGVMEQFMTSLSQVPTPPLSVDKWSEQMQGMFKNWQQLFKP